MAPIAPSPKGRRAKGWFAVRKGARSSDANHGPLPRALRAIPSLLASWPKQGFNRCASPSAPGGTAAHRSVLEGPASRVPGGHLLQRGPRRPPAVLHQRRQRRAMNISLGGNVPAVSWSNPGRIRPRRSQGFELGARAGSTRTCRDDGNAAGVLRLRCVAAVSVSRAGLFRQHPALKPMRRLGRSTRGAGSNPACDAPTTTFV